MSKTTKGNWVGGPNAQLDQTVDRTDEKNMARKIGEGILTGQNGKEKRKLKQLRIFGLLKIGNLIQMVSDLKILQNIFK
jgi:hypothetical protein